MNFLIGFFFKFLKYFNSFYMTYPLLFYRFNKPDNIIEFFIMRFPSCLFVSFPPLLDHKDLFSSKAITQVLIVFMWINSLVGFNG